MIDPVELRDVFDRAASLPPQERGAFLARACGANDGLLALAAPGVVEKRKLRILVPAHVFAGSHP